MAHRSGSVEVVRSVGSPSVDEDTSEKNISVNEEDVGGGGGVSGNGDADAGGDLSVADTAEDDADLPQCKIRRNYSCSLCPFFSQNPRSFLYHSRDVHFDRIKIYECSQCLYASKHSQKLQRHINMIHVAGKNRVRRGNRVIKTEKRREPRPIKPKPPDPCLEVISIPVEAPKQEESYVGEVETVVKAEPENGCQGEDAAEGEETPEGGEFKCSLCNFKNRNQKLIRRHEKIVHLKKRFLRCSKCSYVTHVKARYTKHVKYHSMPMIKCDLCDFRTPYKWNLDRHYKNHSGTGAFQCSKCNFRADIKQSLTVHEMNHHVPPVGQGAVMARKKNKVGASEAIVLENDGLDKDEMELLRMEREDSDSGTNQEVETKEDEDTENVTNFQKLRNVKVPYSNKRESANNNHLQTDFIHPDDIVPRYGQIFVKNLKCKFCSYKAVFSHEIWRHEKRIHGYVRPENKKENAPKRPPPKLIPIQNKNAPTGAILKIPSVKNKSVPTPEASPNIPDKPVNEKEFSEMCKKSSLTSSLKDFVSLIGDEEGLKTIPDSSREDLESECSGWVTEPSEDTEMGNEDTKQKQTDLLKKKNASFFDKLKEKLMTGNNEEQSLFCELCGHESKCLSEAVAHQKRHSNANYKSEDGHPENDIVLSGAELSSTRCQHCRQRCKTSTDLINHLKSCKAFGASQLNADEMADVKEKVEPLEEEEEKPEEDGLPMENRVFVWNDLRHVQDEGEEEGEVEGMEVDAQLNGEPLTTLPGYGTVTSKGSDNTESGNLVMEADPRLSLTLKKVFKCPHCSFWASTASRFHVHIVGHLNKKPFECSLCLYRSNWRWDITKHIRLKSLRDPSHSEAKVNMTDETGRRNYSKYNRFLTMMRVQEPTAESSGTGRRSRPSDATQGNVTENDIIPLPAPPRLTRAPTPGVAHQVPQGVPLRPPPPLKAAHQIASQPSLLKSPKEPGKKTFWKCKKCNFRDSQKGRVLLHVKKHYMFKKGEKCNSPSAVKASGSLASGVEGIQQESSPAESRSVLKTPSYRCGHCHQVSNWKHVIQRHCKLKHNGDALIQVGWKEESQEAQTDKTGDKPQEKTEELVKTISCDICPFTTDTEGDLTAHKLNHVDRPGSIFKCTYCPFYVPSKIAVLEHMEIHGVNDGCDLTTLKVDNFDPSECNEDFTNQNGGSSGECSKRYKCRQCPYLSNSRTQFLYHKQFHRPRDSPFKCMYCSYNVSRRHLLHQHLRVHHNQKGASTSEAQPQEPNETPPATTTVQSGTTAMEMPEIPLVWVLKSGNIQKMFKCRWCPHVNVRKINIQEHEKMHRAGENKNPSEGLRLQCPDCNYTCNNAGVLASHVKVHQGFYGEIRSLVDPTRPEAEQIQELQNSLRVVEPEVVIVEGSVEGVEDEPLSSQPENAYNHTSNGENNEESKKLLSFCDKCPARFFFKKELRIHSKFHMIHLPFRCSYCTYTARQRPHLLAHYKVHSQEYQDKTAGLVESYAVSPDCPQPKTNIITKESYVMEGPVWTVTAAETPKGKPEGHQKPTPKHACHRCPAKFFKSVALQYHLTLHGGSYQHKCKYCDYTVKTYGNLIKHQLVHEVEPKERASKGAKFSYSFPISGTDLLQQRMDDEIGRKKDPQFGTLMFGSPEFIYPTYLKNGKLKQKRYKCHKCPSAFEKRDQYRIHLSLHGSKQKYRCETCDYSVKYYANYVQHMRKHQSHDEAVKARKTEEPSEEPPTPVLKEEPQEKTTYELTLLEQQTLLLQERKKFEGKEEERKSFGCGYCPYVSNRRDAADNHEKRHYRVSGVKSGFECSHCDYSATQSNFLREHIKLHFSGASRYKAEAYLKCERIELWCSDEKGKDDNKGLLVFQDKGEEEEEAKRYYPPIENCLQEENDWRIFVNPETGEPVGEDGETLTVFEGEDSPIADSPQNDDLIEMVEEQMEEVTEEVVIEQVKPKIKRWRGKNWKCKKCPHAFGKRDQYLRHIALHGSNQRHNCDICDYSVKFYTNYVQHMRMHQMHEPDKVIYVKKNLQSLEESSKRRDSEFLTEFPGDSDSYHSPNYSALEDPFTDALLIQDCAKKEDSDPAPVFA